MNRTGRQEDINAKAQRRGGAKKTKRNGALFSSLFSVFASLRLCVDVFLSSCLPVHSLLLLLALTLTGCPPAAPPATILHFKGDVADASVTIDDVYVGALGWVSRHGVGVPMGKHRVTVEKTGYFPWDQMVESEGDSLAVDIKMTKIPD